MSQLWISKERPSINPRVRDGVNQVVILPSTTTSVISRHVQRGTRALRVLISHHISSSNHGHIRVVLY